MFLCSIVGNGPERLEAEGRKGLRGLAGRSKSQERFMLTKISGAFWDWLWRLWYPFLTRLSGRSPVSFLNYGYADDEPGKGPSLMEQDEPDRPCIQLYHHVVSAVDLRGLDVLEVSCGHGGGA